MVRLSPPISVAVPNQSSGCSSALAATRPTSATSICWFFDTVAAAGSITSEAKAMGLPKATVSRSIARLEEAMGRNLFDRLPRGLRLTALGETLLPFARAARATRQEAIGIARSAEAEPRGLVRIATVYVLGQKLVRPVLASPLVKYPQIRLDLVSRNDPVDVLTEKFDLAIGPFRPGREGVVVRDIADTPLGLFASPSLCRRVDIEAPSDLTRFGRICVHPAARPPPWVLTKERETATIDHPPIVTVMDPAAAVELTLYGRGVCLLPEFLARPYLADQRLQRVLPKWSGPVAKVGAALPDGRGSVPAVRACLDAIVAHSARVV